MPLQSYSTDRSSGGLELANQVDRTLTFGFVFERVIVVVEFRFRVGLMREMEGRRQIIWTDDLVPGCRAHGSILVQRLVHHVPSVNPPFVPAVPSHIPCATQCVRARTNRPERSTRFDASPEQSRLRLALKCPVAWSQGGIDTGAPGTEVFEGKFARFKRRAARTGDEVRRPAVSQQRLRVLAGARPWVSASPYPVQGASGIRDSTQRKTSCADTAMLR